MALPYQPLSPAQRVWLAVAAAAAIHVVMLPLIAKDAVFKFVAPPKRAQVSLVPWSSSSASAAAHSQANPLAASKSPTAKTEAEKKKEEEEKLEQAKINGQIVSMGPPLDERAPIVPTKYLSEFDSRVLKETRARETSAFYKNALSKVQKEGKDEKVDQKAHATTAPETPPPPGTSSVDGKEGGGQVAQAPAALTPWRTRQDRVQMQTAENGTVRNRSASDALRGDAKRLAMAQPTPKSSSQVEGRGEGAPGGIRGAPNGTAPLKLALDNPLQSLGPIAGGPMPDSLQDVEEGDGTYLNSHAFLYASYMNRLKETVARIWVPDVQQAATARDPSGQIYLYKDRRTDVIYTLDKNGAIIDPKVRVSSGVDFLDQAALEAFRKAERIPNPPAAMLGPEGKAAFVFSFIFGADHGGALIKMAPAYMPGAPGSPGY